MKHDLTAMLLLMLADPRAYAKQQVRTLQSRADLGGGGGLIGVLIGALIAIVIFVALAPVVANQVAGVKLTNFTNGSNTLFQLTTLLFVVLGFLMIVGLMKFNS